jgi:hypothetical protein
MSKRSPGSKYAMKQGKERYLKEREAHRQRVARREATEQEVTEEGNK